MRFRWRPDIARTVPATVIALLAGPAGALATASTDPAPGGSVPTGAPLALLASSADGQVSVTRVDPLTLAPTGTSSTLPEYHDTYSFSPDRSAIGFGVSTDSGTGEGRIGVRVLDSSDLSIAADINTGVNADYVAWLRPRRLVALLGMSFSGGPCPAPPCPAPAPDDPDHSTVVTVNPLTEQVLERRKVPLHCDAAEARERALISLAGRRLSMIGSDGDVRSVRLPRQFSRCGDLVVSPGAEEAFVVARHANTVAEVALKNSRLTLHRFPAGPGGEVEAVGLDRNRLVLAHRRSNGRPLGVEVLDTERERRRMIDPGAGQARVSNRTILTFGRRRSSRSTGIGVRGFSRTGRRRFWLLRTQRIRAVEIKGRFAYVLLPDAVAVINVSSGTVVSRAASNFDGQLLTQQPARSAVTPLD